MNIRAYCENDYPSIITIYANSKLDELRFESKSFKLLRLEQDKKRLSAFLESDIYVFDDGHVRGYGAIYNNEIRALFVCPSTRGNGIGKALLEFLLTKVNGSAKLYVAKTNTPAKALYQKYGFAISSEFLTDYNGEPVNACEMVRITH